jgi:hypothetical protein
VQLCLELDGAPPLPEPVMVAGLPEPVLAAAAALLGQLIARMAGEATDGPVSGDE